MDHILSQELTSATVAIPAPAKIAPHLEVLPQRSRGRWAVHSLALPIDLYDTVEVALCENPTITVECDDPCVTAGTENTCFRAAQRFFHEVPEYSGGAVVKIIKRIPPSSGLGGGSSNAAAVVRALGRLLKVCTTLTEQRRLCGDLGMDANFFSDPAPALVGGIGDVVHRLPPTPMVLSCLLIDPKIPFMPRKTAQIFARIARGALPSVTSESLSHAWSSGDIDALNHLCVNFLNEQLVPEFAPAFRLQEHVQRNLGLRLHFTGSGPWLTLLHIGAPPPDLDVFCSRFGATISSHAVLVPPSELE